MKTGLIAYFLAQAIAGEAGSLPSAPPAHEVAPKLFVISGAILPERGPDGNTTIIDAPQGLIVVDTGRHVWHSDAILAFAEARHRPIAAIFNTHWHLDHSSGNRRLRAEFPNAPVYTTNAIARALAPGGFLARNRNPARLEARLADPEVSEVEKYEIRNGMATMAEPEALLPTIPLEHSSRMRVAGRNLDVRITNGAVTDADVWIYDRRTRTAIVGDLVTFPSPFFETACPNRWRDALDAVWATSFRIVIPGHGAPMDRAQFDAYRSAYNAFINCVNTDQEATRCATTWVEGAAQFLPTEAERAEALEYADYYVGYLRDGGGKSADCLSD